MKNRSLSQIDEIIHADSVAIVGASGSPGKVGRMFLERYIEAGFGTIYPVNPSETEILSYKTYPSVSKIPHQTDLVHILLPPKFVAGVVEECISKGVKGIIITSAGLGMEGDDARAEEAALIEQAKQNNVRIIGPNCIGIYCPESHLPFPLGQPMRSGDIGIVSQSGSFADLLTKIATANGLHFSKVISCGNETDLDAIDFIEYLEEDPATKTILLYLEGIKNGGRFNELLGRISRKKPIVAWKCGTTQAGAKAAVSHTGALAGSRDIWAGVLNAGGVISVNSLEESLDCLYMINTQPIPNGKRVAVVTGPGGPAVGVMDTLVDLGMDAAILAPETIENIRKIIPPFGSSAKNPVDLSIAAIEMPQMYGEVIEQLNRDVNVDMVLVIGMGGEKFCRTIIDVSRKTQKNLAVTIISPLSDVARDTEVLLNNNIPAYPDAKRAANALAKYADYGRFLQKTGI